MQIIAKALDGLSIETGLDLQKVLCVTECSSLETALLRLEAMLPLYRSRLGAMLFLVSALLSRGMVSYFAAELPLQNETEHIHCNFHIDVGSYSLLVAS